MSAFRYRVQRYNPGTGAFMGPSPIPRSLEAAAPLNDTPSMTVSFNDPTNVVRAPAELAVEVSFDDGQTWTEPANMRFAVMGDNRDRIKSPKSPALKAVGMFWQLKKAVVLEESGPLDAEGRRAWSSVTPGALIRTLIQEAQARGVIPWLDISTFSSTLDSNGVAWPTTFSTSHEIGIGYDAITIALADAGLIDFQMVGRSLRAYVADTFLAPSATAVVLVEGKDFTEATEEVTYELVASRNLIKGDGVSTVVVDAAADKPWGEWEVVTSASGSTTLADLNKLADLGSARSSLRQTQRTYTAYPNASSTSPKPWLDYKVGDQIAAQTDSTLESNLRVRQMTLRGDGSSAQVTLVLGDRLLEREVRLQRLLKASSGGIVGAGGGSSIPGTPSPPFVDAIAPNPPTGIALSSTAVFINDAVVADLTIQWTAPTTNTDSTIFDDFDHYEVQTKRTALGSTYWEAGGTTTLTVITVGALVPGASYDARVRAVDKSGNFSTWLTGTLTTNMDGTAPNKPSTGSVVAELGILFYYWDGKDEFGNNPPGDFNQFRVYMSTSSGFTIGTANFVDAISSAVGGRVPIGDLVYGTTYFFKTTMVDSSGNESVPSTQVSGIPVRVSGLDVEALAIATTHLQDDAVTSIKIVNAAITSAKIGNLQVLNAAIANLAVDDAKIANMAIGKLTVGILGADMTVSARIKTANTGARAEMNSAGFKAYNSSNVLTFDVDSSNGNVIATGIYRTALSGQRIVMDALSTYATIYFYPAVGTNYAYINSPGVGLGMNSGYDLSINSENVYSRIFLNPLYATFEVVELGTQVLHGGQVLVGETKAEVNVFNTSSVRRTMIQSDASPYILSQVFNSAGTIALSEMRLNSTDAYFYTFTSGGATNGKILSGGSEAYIEWMGGGSTKSRFTANNSEARMEGYSGGSQTTKVYCNSTTARLEHTSTGNGFQGNSTGPYIFGVLAPGGSPTTIGVDAGLVRFMSSSMRYKTNIEEAEIDIDDWLRLRPVTYEFKADVEEGREPRRHVGFIAEEVHDRILGPSMVSYIDGNVESVYPLAISAAHQAILRKHEKEIAVLNARLSAAGL